MAFCNWCQLDSDSEDTCVWCRRPLTRNFSVFAGRDAVSLLREEHDGINDRAAGIIGACVAILFFGVVAYAAITYGGRGSSKIADPLSTIAESELTWSGERPATPVSASAPPTAYIPPPTRSVAPAQPSQPQMAPRTPSPNAGVMNAFSGVPTASALRDDEQAPTSGVFIESAKITASVQRNGKYTIHGKVYVANVSGMRVDKLTFALVVGEQRIPLEASAKDLGHGITGTFSVKATDIEPEIARSPDARIQVSATTANGTVNDSLSLGG